MIRILLVFFGLVIFGTLLCRGSDEESVTITKATRLVDLTTHVLKTNVIFVLENTGNGPIGVFNYIVDAQHAKHLAFISAKLDQSEDSDVSLTVKPTGKDDPKKGRLFEVRLSTPLAPSGTITVVVETVFTGILEPYPSQITQAEKQLIRYQGNHYVYSPYKIASQTTNVKLTSSKVISNSQLTPVQQKENTITYGPYENKAAYSTDKLTVHYENNGPFLVVTGLTRLIEISHWGNIAVEETYFMRHSGAKLRGSFSRYDYQRNPTGSGLSSIRSFKSLLPAGATDVYYRDEIGNISTSNMLPLDEAVELEIRPRFPLFGGWQTNYYIGYNLPSYQYLFYKGSHFKLKMRFLDHIYDDEVVEDMLVKIILPEGAKNIKLSAPYGVSERPIELHFTYLDTFGRPVVIASAKNLVEQHIQDFELDYEFSSIYMLQEPFLMVGAFFLIFLSVIMVTRIDFTITKDHAHEARLKASGSKELVDSVCHQLHDVYNQYNAAIASFRNSKDVKVFQGTKKPLETSVKDMLAELGRLKEDVASGDPDAGEKVAKIDHLEKEYVKYMKESAHLAEGKVGKESPHNAEKKLEILAEIEGLLHSL